MTDLETLSYFRNVRREIEPLLPRTAARIMEVGCGTGATLRWLKDRFPGTETVGVDGYAPAQAELDRNVGQALIHDLNTPLPDLGDFDLILALDVLEHLTDPEAVMKHLVSMLRPGGAVIISVPNIANYSVSLPLLFKRRFRYQDAGLLDRTHIRFFTEESALNLVQSSGLVAAAGIITGFKPRRVKVVNALTLGAFRHYLALQYVIKGMRADQGPKLKWRQDA